MKGQKKARGIFQTTNQKDHPFIDCRYVEGGELKPLLRSFDHGESFRQ